MSISNRGEKVKRKFRKCMELFLFEGGSCDYDINFLLRYRHLFKRWIPNELPQVGTFFFLNGRIYRIAPSHLHGLGLFSMDGIMVKYGTEIELMEYVKPSYKHNDWLLFVQYTRSMRRYGVAANYIQLLDNNLNKGATMYIDGRPKASQHIRYSIAYLRGLKEIMY